MMSDQSVRENILAALLDLIKAALPAADVARNPDKPEAVGPGGRVNIFDGEPGEPEVDFSPLAYNYEHRIGLEILGYESASLTREQVVDRLLIVIGNAIEADRRLGGLAEWLEPVAPNSDDMELFGAETGRAISAVIVACYRTSNPFL